MIKFLLGFVAFVIVLLAAYMFTNKPEETAKKETISQIVKKDVSNKEVEVSETKEVKTSKKVVSVAKPSKDLQRSVSKVTSTTTSSLTDTIGEGITLESIKNAAVSNEEKEIMLTDMLYYQNKHNTNNDRLTPSEIDALMTKDIEEGRVP